MLCNDFSSLTDGGCDVHDSVRVDGSVDVLRQLAHLLGQHLCTILLVLEILLAVETKL